MPYSPVPYLLPSANPALCVRHLPAWLDMGYLPVVAVDSLAEPAWRGVEALGCRVVSVAEVTGCSSYPGWYVVNNALARLVFNFANPFLSPEHAAALRSFLPGSEASDPPPVPVVVMGGDDMLPDPRARASEIREAFVARFPDLCGVMQPVGDEMRGTDLICGSPWVGRGWAARAYLGRGCLCPEYHSFFGDEELLHVARAAGRLWQAPQWSQRHEHWSRSDSFNYGCRTGYHEINQGRWSSDESVFRSRSAAGFPGSGLLPASPEPVSGGV